MAKKSTKIKSIEEVSFQINEKYYSYYDGIVITLENDSVIKMGISNSQNCCEQFGYLLSEDDLSSFIGAKFLKVERVTTLLETIEVPSLDCGDAMFINITTSKGLLQIVVYNSHNGYYGHHAVLIENNILLDSQNL